MTCIGPACDKSAQHLGTLCHAHYEQQRKGNPLRPLRHTDARRRFWAQVDTSGDCWIWQGCTDGGGRYGMFTADSRRWPAHRLAYTWAKGDVSTDLVMDHLCRTTLCVNPDHLEPVPQTENIMRGIAPTSFNSRKVRCQRGHVLTESNVRITTEHGGRQCLDCAAMPEMKARRAWQQRKRRAAKAGIPFTEPEPPLPPTALSPIEATVPGVTS